jgi:hypothetical protein
MSKYAFCLISVLVVARVAAGPIRSVGIAQDNAVRRDNLQPMTVRGEIWDSTCAAAGSHGKVMAKTQAKDVKECTLNCVKGGAQLVLYNTDDKTIYRLDSQDKVTQYAGQTVTVIGSYDRATDILHVDRIETEM